jgi:phage terminase small subunit
LSDWCAAAAAAAAAAFTMVKAEKNKVAPDADADDGSQRSGSTFDDRKRALKDEEVDERKAATQPAHMFQEQTDDDFVRTVRELRSQQLIAVADRDGVDAICTRPRVRFQRGFLDQPLTGS